MSDKKKRRRKTHTKVNATAIRRWRLPDIVPIPMRTLSCYM